MLSPALRHRTYFLLVDVPVLGVAAEAAFPQWAMPVLQIHASKAVAANRPTYSPEEAPSSSTCPVRWMRTSNQWSGGTTFLWDPTLASC